jgi:phosphohistidine phosphatase
MLLHLIRHGHALAADQDAGRPLSPQGRNDVERLAAHLRAAPAGMPATLWHSPYRRARETAALLAQHAGRQVMLVGKSFLTPDDDPAKIAGLLAELPPAADLGIVGHEPHLGALATLLVTGTVEPVKFSMDKAGALTLAPADGSHAASGFPRWKVEAYFVPPMAG